MVLCWILFQTENSFPADLVIYIKPDGNDHADGLRKNTALKSLQLAIDRSFQMGDTGHHQHKIVVGPGVYLGQKVTAKGLPEGKPLVISAEEEGASKPHFDGNGKGGTWLTLKNSEGGPTRLIIEGLEVSNYRTAISLNGARTSETASNSQNVIRNNVFRNIGQISDPAGEPSAAAIRLVNSDDNQIIKNHFINIRNINRCGALHSIYIAHYSTGNYIAENIFDGGCGATIKVRDASNNNVIANNRFLNQEANIFLDSFCDKNKREDCTKGEAECPSWNNEFRYNIININGKRTLLSPVKTIGSTRLSGCIIPQSSYMRVKQEGNVIK
jgi:hypothetical protein